MAGFSCSKNVLACMRREKEYSTQYIDINKRAQEGGGGRNSFVFVSELDGQNFVFFSSSRLLHFLLLLQMLRRPSILERKNFLPRKKQDEKRDRFRRMRHILKTLVVAFQPGKKERGGKIICRKWFRVSCPGTYEMIYLRTTYRISWLGKNG